jgi:hypothetical protein
MMSQRNASRISWLLFNRLLLQVRLPQKEAA